MLFSFNFFKIIISILKLFQYSFILSAYDSGSWKYATYSFIVRNVIYKLVIKLFIHHNIVVMNDHIKNNVFIFVIISRNTIIRKLILERRKG